MEAVVTSKHSDIAIVNIIGVIVFIIEKEVELV